jgi:hypothetical protein
MATGKEQIKWCEDEREEPQGTPTGIDSKREC